MKNKLKKNILKMLSENLEMFHPEFNNCFMCPTCLTVVPIENLDQITEAHIVPKAAGGKLKTFLCKKCNSTFGAKQDKWFGEIIRMSNDKKSSIFATAIKDGYFFFDDIKVNGHWEEKKDGGFSFFVHSDRNSPDVNRKIREKFGSHPPEVKLKLPLPILRNQHLMDVGYLTAAYLMWFGLLGYSWALQSHLKNIRLQILRPENDIIESKYIFSVEPANWKPWVGLVSLYGDIIPAFGLKKHMVVLPPNYKPEYYASLKKGKGNINLSDIRVLQLPDKPSYGPPISIIYENQLVVFAKPSANAIKQIRAILFNKDSNQGQIMTYIDEPTYDRLKQLKNVKNIKIKVLST